MKKTLIVLLCLALCSCSNKEVYFEPAAPVISFSHTPVNSYGENEYYLFDDNPEYLNEEFLADSTSPNSIAYFEDLSGGVYTVFSYHHRGTSVPFDKDLFFDICFLTENCSIEIISIGLDHNWSWNQVWADFTGLPVYSPMYYETSRCTCGRDSSKNNGMCEENCEGIVYDKSFFPSRLFQKQTIHLKKPTMLSDILPEIQNTGLNKFRYGGAVEPMWIMMKFRIVSGKTDFATVAYSKKEEAENNLLSLGKGRFYNEPQYKGIAASAPLVTAEFSYTVTNDTPKGAVPVSVKNMRVPNGYTIKNGCFATFINTWRLEKPIAAESDLLLLEYKDSSKLSLYGKPAENPDDIWRFDPYHTKLYSYDYNKKDADKLKIFGVKSKDGFIPNIPMDSVDYPAGNEASDYEFYRLMAANLGNFGVTARYIMHITNGSSHDINWVFEMLSDAGQVYRYRLYNADGTVVSNNFDCYTAKLFDNSPRQTSDDTFTQPAKYSSKAEFFIPKGESFTAELEITTLTGCNSPMYNTIKIEY